MSPPKPEAPFLDVVDVPEDLKVVPKATVLFMVDDSPSMKNHIENLRVNAPKLAAAIKKRAGANADLRIGVVGVWDADVPASCPYQKGALRPVCGSSGERFVTPKSECGDRDWATALAQTLAIPVVDSEKYDSANRKVRLCGPEAEEVFSPVLAALDPATNPGFDRPDATLSIVLVTDANSSPREIVADEFVGRLRALRNGHDEMISTYAIMSLSKGCEYDNAPVARWYGDPETEDRKLTPGAWRDPGEIGRFIALTNASPRSHLFDLCDGDWGDKLNKIGADMAMRMVYAAERASSKPLAARPDLSQTHVTCAGREIPNDFAQGWTYDLKTNSISLPMSVLRGIPNCKQAVIDSIAVPDSDVQRGRVVPE
jgi:hypothetical protein